MWRTHLVSTLRLPQCSSMVRSGGSFINISNVGKHPFTIYHFQSGAHLSAVQHNMNYANEEVQNVNTDSQALTCFSFEKTKSTTYSLVSKAFDRITWPSAASKWSFL